VLAKEKEMIVMNFERIWVCEDCIPIIAYGDSTHLDYHLNEEDSAERLKEIEEAMEGRDITVGEDEDEDEFSIDPCGCCGTHLHGKRFECFEMEKTDVQNQI
jgi:hypothetical protein